MRTAEASPAIMKSAASPSIRAWRRVSFERCIARVPKRKPYEITARLRNPSLRHSGSRTLAAAQTISKSSGSQSGCGYSGSMASRVARTMLATAALRAHLRSDGITYQGACFVEQRSSMVS